jgi:serine/threonine protein kinase
MGEGMLNPGGPQQLGNYRLMQRLGSGGFAEVYLGEHIHLGRQAAIKVLKLQEDKTGQADFLEEARRAAALQHPHIITVLDFGIEYDLPFLVMDYAPYGTLLKRHPRSTRVPLPTVLEYVRQIASALQYAHQLKVIHRDVKPENMLIGTHGKILLGDFGISIVAHRPETMTPQVAAGTYIYMAPEQAQGFACPESDQYALAVVVYEWLSGFPPFNGPSFIEILMHHMKDAPPSLQQRVPELPPAVDDVILRALAKEPQQRFPSIMDFAIALEQAATGQQPIRLPKKTTTEVVTDDPTIRQPIETAGIPTPTIPQQNAQPSSPQLSQLSRPIISLAPSQSSIPIEQSGAKAADIAATRDTGQIWNAIGSGKGNTGEMPLSALASYFTAPQERLQLSLVMESRGIWLEQQSNNGAGAKSENPSAMMDIEECYHQGLLARAHNQLEVAILWWLQGLTLQPAYNNGVLLKLVKEELRTLRARHLEILQNRMEQAHKQINLDEELRLLEDMLILAPQDKKVSDQLVQARQDKEFFWMYQKARQFLDAGNALLAIEQVNVLQSLAPTFRNLPGLREQTIVFMTTQIQQSMTSDNFPRARQQLQQLHRLAPKDQRLNALEDEWCQKMYQKAQRSIQGPTPAAALMQINAIKEIRPRFKGGLEDLRATVYQRMCNLVRQEIDEHKFTEAQQQLNEIAQSFSPIDRKAFTPLPMPSGQQAAKPSGTANPQTYGTGYTNMASANGMVAVQMQEYPSTFDTLQVLLHERQTSYTTRQQQSLFRQGEKARQRGDYAEAKKLWQELQQQNNKFVSNKFSIAEHLERLVVEQAKQAEKSADWRQAQALWQEVKDTWPSNTQAAKRLQNATLNLRYTPIYQQAKQHVEQKQTEKAKPLLAEIWKNAPGFGDPAKLARPTDLYSPLPGRDAITNICLIGIPGMIISLVTRNLLLGIVLSLIIAAAITARAFNDRKGQPWQHGAIIVAGCLIAILLSLLLGVH